MFYLPPPDLYLPIKDIKYQIIPDVDLRGKNLWEVQVYAQENDLTVLSSADINRVANAVREDIPSKQFIRYARKRAELNDNDVGFAYRRLHQNIWIKRFHIIAREVLVWMASDSSHPRVISDKTPSEAVSSEVVSYLIKDYRVVDRGKNDYVLDTTGIPNPVIPVNWLRESGTITRKIANLLGVPENTYVLSGITGASEPEYFEGMRMLSWAFYGPHVKRFPIRSPSVTDLIANRELWYREPYMGSLLGRKL